MMKSNWLIMRLLAWLVLALMTATPAAAIQWFDDFNDGNAEDGSPLTWTFNEIGATPGIYDASSGDYVLTAGGADGFGNDDNLVASPDVTLGDTYARTQAVIQPDELLGVAGGNVGLVARFNPFSFSGYAAVIDDGGQYSLLRSDGGVLEELANDTLAINALTDIMIELQVVGSELSLFFWDPAEPMPTTPVATANDATYSMGRAGIVYNEDDDWTGGIFRFAAAQDSPFELPPAADLDGDGDVDRDDYLLWQAGFGSAGPFDKDPDGDGDLDGHDFLIWQGQFGTGVDQPATVPEPSAALLAVLLGCGLAARRRR